jgi:hypothetical protein
MIQRWGNDILEGTARGISTSIARNRQRILESLKIEEIPCERGNHLGFEVIQEEESRIP